MSSLLKGSRFFLNLFIIFFDNVEYTAESDCGNVILLSAVFILILMEIQQKFTALVTWDRLPSYFVFLH